RLAASAPTPSLEGVLAALARHVPGIAAPPGSERLAWIRAGVGDDVHLIAVTDVAYFQANDKYTTVVNLEHVRTTTRDLAGRVTLALKTRPEKVQVSRAYAHRFKQM